MSKQKTLLVGCGGSGITTLMRFNEMLAGNPEWRELLWESVSYLVIDTEVEKTRLFQEAIKRQLGRAKKPIVRLVQITKGYQQLDQIVNPNFDKRVGTPQGDRLRENWWFAPGENGKAYRAKYIRNIEKGAGQCGLVSYLCAWDYLPRLKEDLDSILTEIQNHNIGEDDPLAELRVYIVTGTAGGTGRGSWNLVAFKVRQALLEMGHDVNPDGIFFDSSCFPNAVAKNPDQALSTKINSLTAFSELSAWMNVRDTGRYRFRLPDLSDPDPNPKGSTDVIKVEDDESDDNKCSPVSSSYLIFGNNGRGSLKDNTQYHEMAAAALYAMVVGACYIDPGAINRLTGFGSLAAVSCEVDTVKLRAYFESIVRKSVVKKVCESPKDNPALEEEARKLVGTGADSDASDSFFATTRFLVDAPMSSASVSVQADPGPGAPLVQKLIAAVRADRASIVDNFRKELEKQNPKATWSKVQSWLRCNDLDDARVAEILDKVLGPLGGDALRQTIVEAAMRAYAPEKGKSLPPSIGRAQAAIALMANTLKVSIKNLETAIRTGEQSYAKPDAVETGFKKLFDAKATKGFLEFKPFTSDEIKDLCTSFDWHLNLAIFFKFRQALKTRFESAIAALREVEGGFQTLVGVLSDVCDDYDKEAIGKEAAEKGVTDAYDALFVKESDKAVRAALPAANATEVIYRRVIKPIMSKESIEELVLRKESHTQKDSEIAEEVSGQLIELLNAEKGPNEDDKLALRSKFFDLFKANVFLDKDFMATNFSLEKVLKNNLVHWNQLLADSASDPDELDNIKDCFRSYLGVEEVATVDNKPRIPFENLFRDLVVSMVGTCKPWIRLQEKHATAKGEYLVTLALLPIELEDEEAFRSTINEVHPSQDTTVIHRGRKTEGGHRLPLDRIVVFASQDIKQNEHEPSASVLDRVVSLNYWQEARVKEGLERAERIEPTEELPSAYFEWTPSGFVERKRGLGYMSPVFIRDETFAALRWKPWAPRETISVQKANETAVTKALLYALLGTGLEPDDPILADLREKFNWQLPLLVMGRDKTEDFNFTRDLLAMRDGKGFTSIDSKWQADEKLSTSLDNVYLFLLGKGKKGEDGSRLQALIEKGNDVREQIAAESDLFAKSIASTIGLAALQKLRDARNTWIKNESRKASPEDKPFWAKLLELAGQGE